VTARNIVTRAAGPNSTEVWTNTDPETGEVLRYRFVPCGTVQAGDRLELCRQFAPGRGVKVTEGLGRALTGPEATALRALPAGTMVRTRELAPEES
jgi:hypothetical protein